LSAAEHVGDRIGPGDRKTRRDRTNDGDAGDRQRDAEHRQREPFGTAADVGQREPDEAHEGVPGGGGDRRRSNGRGRIADLTDLHRQGWSGRKVSPTAARNVVGVNSEVLRLRRYCADTTDFVVELSCGGRSLPPSSA